MEPVYLDQYYEGMGQVLRAPMVQQAPRVPWVGSSIPLQQQMQRQQWQDLRDREEMEQLRRMIEMQLNMQIKRGMER